MPPFTTASSGWTEPTGMLAARLESFGQPLAARRCPVPLPGAGEVLVRVAAAPINPSDLAFLRGHAHLERTLPATPGTEGSGTVIASGGGAFGRWLVGRRVACASSSGRGGTWAEFLVTAARRCVPLRRDVTLEQGAMLLVNPLSALGLLDVAQSGRHAAVVNTAAASALGRMLMRLFRSRGIEVVAVVRRAELVEAARAEGADAVLVESADGFADELRRMAHERRATLALDAIAGDRTAELLRAVPRGGRVVVYGVLSGEAARLDPRSLLFDDKRLSGFYLPNYLAGKGALRVLGLTAKAQRLIGSHLATTVQAHFPLSKAQQAVEHYERSMSMGKVLLVADEQLAAPTGTRASA